MQYLIFAVVKLHIRINIPACVEINSIKIMSATKEYHHDKIEKGLRPVVIKHGIPNHPFFSIVVPPSYIQPTLDASEPGYEKPILELEDPITGKRVKAEVHGIATLTINEFIGASIHSLLAYGVTSEKLAVELQRSYPEIYKKQILRYLVLKQL